MLEVKGLSVAYGKHRALDGVGLRVARGEIVVILGANGAGKSTLLKAIAGICEGRTTGSVTMAGEPVLGLPAHRVVERGIALVPEGRGVFGDLTVRENLMLGANPERARDETRAILDRLTGLFPKLAERAGQVVRTMSGGEQQMVAIGRAMMSNPEILMLDEPSLGLSPLLSKELFQNLKAVRQAGLGILLVEQNARLSLGIADRGYLLENGAILREDRAEVLRGDPAVQAAYLGGGGGRATGVARAPAAVAPHQAAPLPPVPLSPVRAPEAVPASRLVGIDIDALVARAGRQAQPVRPAAPAGPSAQAVQGAARALAEGPRADRMREMLAGIEAAAARARKAPEAGHLPPLRASLRDRLAAAAPAQQGADPAPPPAPSAPAPVGGGKVEVWQRRPGTSHFDRKEP
ncbi:MAG TPA: ABC transporter ATP-binding protein [Paracoccaceae bacterium]|nr:ABC transporter ATP-binding protein [Paracoccaceae bacterium]HMO73297.1 ABC transporter ATP-binding protein [Paracoccaceae bacterium]